LFIDNIQASHHKDKAIKIEAIECAPTLEDGYFAIIGVGDQTI
jgi:hypothetical protein